MPERSKLPLWLWVLLGVAPGLFCHALAFLTSLAQRAHNQTFEELGTMVLVFAPLPGLIYLIFYGRACVRAGLTDSSLYSIFGYGAVNLFLWGSGCCMYIKVNVH